MVSSLKGEVRGGRGAVEGGREILLGLVEDVVWHTLLCWLGGGGLV